MPYIKIEKRPQADRMLLAEVLLENIWNEFCNGEIDRDILQSAVYAQTSINRIVWKLNEMANEEVDDGKSN